MEVCRKLLIPLMFHANILIALAGRGVGGAVEDVASGFLRDLVTCSSDEERLRFFVGGGLMDALAEADSRLDFVRESSAFMTRHRRRFRQFQLPMIGRKLSPNNKV